MLRGIPQVDDTYDQGRDNSNEALVGQEAPVRGGGSPIGLNIHQLLVLAEVNLEVITAVAPSLLFH